MAEEDDVIVGVETMTALVDVLVSPVDDTLFGEDKSPEQRLDEDGLGKTRGFGELASWQLLPSQRAPDSTGRSEGGCWMIV